MKELVMIIRPEKLEDIKQILDDIHCGGRRRLHKLWHVCSVLFRTGNLFGG